MENKKRRSRNQKPWIDKERRHASGSILLLFIITCASVQQDWRHAHHLALDDAAHTSLFQMLQCAYL